jgi:hypothetical protein
MVQYSPGRRLNLMADEGVVDRLTGGGTYVTLRGGRGGGGSGSSAGTPPSDDFDRLASMLERLGKILESLIYLEPPLLPPQLRLRFIEVWPETQRELALAIGRLRRELPMPRRSLAYVHEQLAMAGLAGPMLQMKETSLYLHLDPLGDAIRNYSPPVKPILTLPEDEGLFRRLLFLIKPASKVMNSIIGSVPAVIFPGKEIVKEVKDHVEAGYEAVELSRENMNR